MIKVTGSVTLQIRYKVELDMTEEQFDSLSARKQNELIEEQIDWYEACRGGEVHDVDVYDVETA
jgi:hypothetical protein